VFDSSWSSLKEDGERVQMIDDNGTIQEDFTYIPAKTGVLKRLDPLIVDYTSANWAVVEDGAAPGEVNNAEDAVQNDQKAENQNQAEAATGNNQNTQPNESDPQEPIIRANAGADRDASVGEDISFDASQSTSTSGAELFYKWDFEDGERASGKTVVHRFAREGDYHVSLIVSNGQDEDDDEIVVRVMASAADENVLSDSPSANSTKSLPVAEDNSMTGQTTIEGVVLVEPGIFAKTYFYASDGLTSKIVQVYFSSGDFPVLHIGQLIRVHGLTGLYQGIRRVRISAQSDVDVLQGEDPPDPEAILLADITDEYVGRFVRVEGEVLKEDGKIFLKNSNGNGSLRIEVKAETGIKTAELKEGSMADITGIIDKTRTGLRLLPRYPGDIAVVAPAPEKNAAALESAVKGEKTKSASEPDTQLDFTPVGDVVAMPPVDNDKRTAYKYLIATASVLGLTLAALIIQEKRRMRLAE
jgi:PKD repeat protein